MQLPTHAPRIRRGRGAALLAIGGPVCYGGGLAVAAVCDGRSPDVVACFDPAGVDELTFVRAVAAVAMGVGAVGMLVLVPWMLGTRFLAAFRRFRTTAGAWSLALNSAALVAVFLLLRNTLGIDRVNVLATWLGWTAVLLRLSVGQWPWGDRWLRKGGPGQSVGWLGQSAAVPQESTSSGPGVQRGHGASRRTLRLAPAALCIGLAAVLLGVVLFAGEHFVQCFNGDGTETFQLARSLQENVLPSWELETTDQFGAVVVNPSLINSYWTCAFQLLLGEGELATRLPFWIWWTGIFAVGVSMARPGRTRRAWPAAIPWAALLLLMALWYTFYVGYYPYVTDPANPGVTDGLFTLWLLLGLNCLRRRDPAGWVVMTVMASLVLYAGPVMFVLTAAAGLVWQPLPRRVMLRWGLTGVCVLLLILLGYLAFAQLHGLLPGWIETIRDEYVQKHLVAGPRGTTGLLFVGYFLLGCGGVAAWGMVEPFLARSGVAGTKRRVRLDAPWPLAWRRTVATMTLAYLAMILGSVDKNLHYLGPLLPLCLVLFLAGGRRTTHAEQANVPWRPIAAALGLLASIVLCWPTSRSPFTLNRQLGAATTFQTDSYEEACRWARITHHLYDTGRQSWWLSQHTWVDYSQLDANPWPPRPLLVTDDPNPPAGYALVFRTPDGVGLYSDDPQWTEWLRTRSPPPSEARFPWVLRPIAIKTRPQKKAG